MWTTLSASRWICLLTLAVVMLFSASQVDSQTRAQFCCEGGSFNKIKNIKKCNEQTKRRGCQHHAFVITTTDGARKCINPAAKWLNDKIDKQEFKCGPAISRRRFEVLYEDDVE